MVPILKGWEVRVSSRPQSQPGMHIKTLCPKRKIKKEKEKRKEEQNAKEFMNYICKKQALKLCIRKHTYTSTTQEAVAENYKYRDRYHKTQEQNGRLE